MALAYQAVALVLLAADLTVSSQLLDIQWQTMAILPDVIERYHPAAVITAVELLGFGRLKFIAVLVPVAIHERCDTVYPICMYRLVVALA